MLSRVGAAVRDGWLALGMALLVFLLLEAGYRLQAWIRNPESRRASKSWDLPPGHPYAGQAWFREFSQSEGRTDRFDPYRGFWSRPFASRYKNIDSLGRRVTIQPAGASPGTISVLLLGASTMFGFNSRDSQTIPSLVANDLYERGITGVDVTNLAQGGFNSTQEATTLLLEVANGRAPTVAAFLDGNNDIVEARRFGQPGESAAQARIQRLIELGSRGFLGELVGLGRHSLLIVRLQQAFGVEGEAASPPGDAEHICGPLAAYYRNMVRALDGIGREFGFQVVHFLQPMRAVTNKQLTAWERTIRLDPMVRPCVEAIDSALSRQAGTTYFSLADLFDRDTTSVFTDHMGHVTERANRVIAHRIAETVAPALRRK